MTDRRDYKLDLKSLELQPTEQQAGSGALADRSRPFLRVLFTCCNVYQRVYLSADNQHYHARCPRCLATIRFRIGDGGTEARGFIVG